ncbi:MAG: hypothetical protein CMI63_04295 [Parvularcula sp.]|uniref:hypothetical protein n=1 Tax=Hyphococcus sp. TaxID=2038636 RepID=UPI000C4D2E06|nr:hypothetical protein [Parvularcula sp.]
MRLSTALLAGAALVALTAPAHAYVDPGTGSVVTTAILGFFAAIGYTARKHFYRLKDMITGKSKKEETVQRES